jgi:hypothetical protein
MMMQQIYQPGLKSMLAEASLALANLDGERLEEMALSCAALVRDADGERGEARKQCESGLGAAKQEMAIFVRVLEATRANLEVIHRLLPVRAARLEYGPDPRDCVDAAEESEHGDH